MKLYHFTSIERLPDILADQVLKRTDSFLQEPTDSERLNATVIGISGPTGPDQRPFWMPPSDNRVVWLTRAGQREKQSGWSKLPAYAAQKNNARITVEVPQDEAQQWIKWAKRNRMKKWWRKALAETDPRNYRSWYVVEREIPMSEWLAVEIWRDGEWVDAIHRDKLESLRQIN